MKRKAKRIYKKRMQKDEQGLAGSRKHKSDKAWVKSDSRSSQYWNSTPEEILRNCVYKQAISRVNQRKENP